MKIDLIRPMTLAAVMLAAHLPASAISSAPPGVPYVTPSRVLPTEEHSPTATPTVTPSEDEDWWRACVSAGTCGDFGQQCPPMDPGDGLDPDGNYSLRSTFWCSRETWPRGKCEGFATTDCVLITTGSYGGMEMFAACRYHPNGTLIGIEPSSVRATGSWCQGSRCEAGGG